MLSDCFMNIKSMVPHSLPLKLSEASTERSDLEMFGLESGIIQCDSHKLHVTNFK